MAHRLFAGSLALCALLVAAPAALADRGHKYHRHHDHHGGHRHVVHRTVVHHRPAPVYYAPVRHVHYAPAPVYYHPAPRRVVHHHHHGCGHDYWKWVGGALVLGSILHHADH